MSPSPTLGLPENLILPGLSHYLRQACLGPLASTSLNMLCLCFPFCQIETNGITQQAYEKTTLPYHPCQDLPLGVLSQDLCVLPPSWYNRLTCPQGCRSMGVSPDTARWRLVGLT